MFKILITKKNFTRYASTAYLTGGRISKLEEILI
jgi:hypothetical protein